MKKLLLLPLTILLFDCCDYEQVKIKGRVLSHDVTSDKYGNATYRTIINCKDGYIRERLGLRFFAVPVGDSCTLYKSSDCGCENIVNKY